MTRYNRDVEYEAYIDERRFIREKIHDHWKKDLTHQVEFFFYKLFLFFRHRITQQLTQIRFNRVFISINIYYSTQKLPKSLNKINNEQSNQWITTIIDNSTTSTNDRIASLVDTFASDLDTESNLSSKVNKYQVNGQVGVIIAERLQNGERLRVGRNGEEVTGNNYNEVDSLLFSNIKKT